MDSLISTFHIDWHIIIAQAVNFIVVMIVLWRFALRPLSALMDERGKKIASGLENATKQEELLKAQQIAYDAELVKARKEARDILENVKQDAESKRAILVSQTQTEVGEMLRMGKKQLVEEKEKMLGEAKTELAEMVVSATGKVLEGIVTKEIDQKLVTESLKDVAS